MKTAPKVGTSHESRFTVETSQVIDLSPGQMPAVLATPWLIWQLEHAALDLMRPFLDSGEVTVGVQIELEHLAAALPGQVVTCRAQVIHVDGPIVSFRIEAHDSQEPLARGVHKRRVVRTDRLRRRLDRKGGG